MDMNKIDKKNIPEHIAIIMDGNGRWAQEQGSSRLRGHREGIHTIQMVSGICSDLDVKILTLYAFSTDNWKRPKLEVKNLMELFKTFMPSKIDELNANDVKMTVMGRLDELSSLVRKGIMKTVESTKNNKGLNLNFAINYGGREEIIDGIKKCIDEKKYYDELTVSNFKEMLYYKNLPDVDLLIRTAGEWRLSNFMLFHIPYSEMVFTDVVWPEFTEQDFHDALIDYQRRPRKFGKI